MPCPWPLGSRTLRAWTVGTLLTLTRPRAAAAHSHAGDDHWIVALTQKQRLLPVFAGALPSKLFDAWACACPTLTSIRGEAQKLVEQAGAGQFVTPENPTELAQAILALSQQPEKRKEMGARGRDFVSQHYSRQAQARHLVTLLEQQIKRLRD